MDFSIHLKVVARSRREVTWSMIRLMRICRPFSDPAHPFFCQTHFYYSPALSEDFLCVKGKDSCPKLPGLDPSMSFSLNSQKFPHLISLLPYSRQLVSINTPLFDLLVGLFLTFPPQHGLHQRKLPVRLAIYCNRLTARISFNPFFPFRKETIYSGTG